MADNWTKAAENQEQLEIQKLVKLKILAAKKRCMVKNFDIFS